MTTPLSTTTSRAIRALGLTLIVCAGVYARPAAPQELARPTVTIAAELGITPESLAVAGLDSSVAFNTLDRIRLDTERKALLAAKRDQLAQASAALQEARAALVASQVNEAAVLAHAQAEAAWNAAISALETARADFRLAALASATPEQRLTIDRWRANAARRVPAAFKVLVRTPDAWQAMERAVRAQARAVRRGETLPADAVATLADVQSDATVVQAISAYAAGIDSIKVAFESYVD